ncbi:MAG: MFS transporter [Treponema sp.]|jgi:MFS family permease|nr:MFS transporter [Treponema sp.]
MSFYKFLIICFAGFIASVGHGLTSFGLGIYVYEQTRIVSSAALIALLAFLPALLLSPLAGVLADKYDRRVLMLLGNGFSIIGTGYILFCISKGETRLWQIGAGVTISSIFTTLIDPAFRATITDLVSKEEYTKASGFVQLSDSAGYLLSPAIAGLLLSFSDIRLLLAIDICTLFITVMVIFYVRRWIVSKITENREPIIKGFKVGLLALIKNKGILSLTVMLSVMTFFVAVVQTLSTPMILGFTDSRTLGFTMTFCASGMLFSSVFLGVVPIKRGFVKVLSLSLFFAGLFMGVFGLRENIFLIGAAGFLIFMTLPFANASIDYLIRTNIDNEVQGRSWGLIGVISQIGYVAAFAVSGPLADYVFMPLLLDNGFLSGSIGKLTGVGTGRGIGLLIIVAGFMLALTAAVLYQIKPVKKLEGDSYVQGAY